MVAVGLAMAAARRRIGGAMHGPADFDGWLGDVRLRGDHRRCCRSRWRAAFGALAANTPVALSAFLLAPTAWAMRGRQRRCGSAAAWFDIFEAYGRLSSDEPLDDIAQTLTAVTVWVVAPAAIGLTRSLRREVR